MARVPTTLLVEESLKEEAKINKINMGKTLEEALKAKLNKDDLIDEKKIELKDTRRKVRQIERELKVLEERKTTMKSKYGNKKERIEKAETKLEEIFDRQGYIDDENIRAVSTISGLTVIEVEEIWKQKNS